MDTRTQLIYLKQMAIGLLERLITTPSESRSEGATAELLLDYMKEFSIESHRISNNVWAKNKHFDPEKPTLLLNSHHDTVKPNSGYTNDPYKAFVKDGKLYGLGSNDAGASLVSLLAVFTLLYNRTDLKYNLVFLASAEEEVSGANGISLAIPQLPPIDVAIVGEPTLMQMAVAEKGLIVFDATVKGTASHAAHINPDNAIYNSIEVLQWFKDFEFPKVSEHLGEVKLTVSQINGGTQHNQVPAEVKLVIDVRVNDMYTNTEINDLLCNEAPCEIKARSLRLNSSGIDSQHPLVKAGIGLGLITYGSPTLSDQALLSCESIKIGPGDSTRSHTADEFVYLHEIEKGIDIYLELLTSIL